MALNSVVGGSFIDASGNPLANGYLTMELCSDEQSTNPLSQVVGGIVIEVPLDNTGNVVAGFEVQTNDTLNPANSCYLVDAFQQDGTRAWKSPQYQKVLSSPSPYNINVWVPGANGGCGCGSGQGGGLCPNGILLQTGGINNGNQCLQNLVAGTNIAVTDDGDGDITVSTTPTGTFSTLIESVSHTPANSSDTGVQGQFAWDGNFFYVCVATNTWVRAALSTF